MNRVVAIDRIELTLDGMPMGEAEFLSEQLQSALAARLQPMPSGEARADAADATPMITPLTGRALVDAIAARLADVICARLTDAAPAEPETEPAPWQ